MNLPNILTLVRILMVPVFVCLYYLPGVYSHLAAALVFALACLTDWLDGYLARYLKQATRLGEFLDPVADKLMVSIALIMIVAARQFQFIIVGAHIMEIPAAMITIPAAIIVSREIIVSALREWMAEIGKRASVAVSHLGKIKTTVQMAALINLISCSAGSSAVVVMSGYFLLYIATFLTLWSMLLYLKAAWIDLIGAS